mmetsp:Transcript_25326/g.60249  ORF Transcript_25326/g.60249 Transcript_25326/m.60249 type:complete len:210 (-) Transcript_25326:582-1211(-)
MGPFSQGGFLAQRPSPPPLPPLPFPTPVSFCSSATQAARRRSQHPRLTGAGSLSSPEARDTAELASSTAAVGATKNPETASQTPRRSPSLSDIMNTSHLLVGILLAGTRRDRSTRPTSTSHRSTCLTTRPVSGLSTWVVPPAAASRGLHGRSTIQLKRQRTSTSVSVSFHSRMSSLTSFRYDPRLETFSLKRSTPLKDTKGSLNSQSGS